MGAEASVGYIAETFASNLRQRCMMPPASAIVFVPNAGAVRMG